MTELRPWEGFDSLVDGLARLQTRAREAAVRSVDEIVTLRSWLIGAWIVAYEQGGTDRARYGEGLIDALAAAFKARGVGGLGRSNLKNYRQIALTWPTLGMRQTSGESRLPSDIRQTLSGELGALGQTWQTLSAESVPALLVRGEALSWQDDAWMLRLRRELSFSHLLELSRASDPVARAFYEVQSLAHRWSVRELKRQRDSMLFERVGLSRDREASRDDAVVPPRSTVTPRTGATLVVALWSRHRGRQGGQAQDLPLQNPFHLPRWRPRRRLNGEPGACSARPAPLTPASSGTATPPARAPSPPSPAAPAHPARGRRSPSRGGRCRGGCWRSSGRG